MPVRTINQNPTTELGRLTREVAGFEACFSIRATTHPHLQESTAFTLRSVYVRGVVARFRTTLKFPCQLAVFSYAVTRLSSKQSRCDALMYCIAQKCAFRLSFRSRTNCRCIVRCIE